MRRESPTILLITVAIYLLVGTLGHDPWRGDDATHFGPVFELLDGGAALIPSVAGDPLPGFGPLFYWLAAALAAATGFALPVPDGARLATTVLAAATLFAVARASAAMHGPQARTTVVLLMLGCLGLVVHAHEIQPAIGLMAAQAWVLWLLVASPGGALPMSGLAAGAAFLFSGLQGLLMTWPLLLSPLFATGAMERRRIGGVAAALTLAAALALAWAVPASHQTGWDAWLAGELEALVPEPTDASAVAGWLKLFGWGLWPLWPLALWSLWRASRGAAIRHVPLLLAAFLLALAPVLLSGGLRSVRMLPLIVPLALLAAPAVERLRRGAAAALDWFSVMAYSAAGLLLWLAWSALVLHWPPGLARHFQKLAPAIEFSPNLQALGLAALLVAGWAIYLWWRRPGGRDAALTAAVGITMLWCISTAMFTPWFDHTRSYRPAADGFIEALREFPGGCISGVGVGAAQRAAIHYYSGRRIRPDPDSPQCALVLVYEDSRSSRRDLARYGTALWSYQRGGGRQRETFTLLHRE